MKLHNSFPECEQEAEENIFMFQAPTNELQQNRVFEKFDWKASQENRYFMCVKNDYVQNENG